MTTHRNQNMMGKLGHSALQLITVTRTIDAITSVAANPVPLGKRRDAEVVECFVRIKQGTGLARLQDRHQVIQEEIDYLSARCARIGAAMRLGDTSDAHELPGLQDDRNRARRSLARVTEQLQLFTDDRQLAVEELEEILCLPKVTAVRTETPDVIVFTVKATTMYKGISYHLGTWDIYFGDEAGIKGLPKGTGDSEHYRVKRVVNGQRRYIDVGEFHNWKDGSFCFGSNKDRVDTYARRGEFLHGMQAMIVYLSTVHPSKHQRIPKMFHPEYKEG